MREPDRYRFIEVADAIDDAGLLIVLATGRLLSGPIGLVDLGVSTHPMALGTYGFVQTAGRVAIQVREAPPG